MDISLDPSAFLGRLSQLIKATSFKYKDGSEVKERTVPFDPRFPNQNQTRSCYVGYIDFQRCKARHGEDYEACQYYKWIYNTMCPNTWIEEWDQQMDAGTFGGPI